MSAEPTLPTEDVCQLCGMQFGKDGECGCEPPDPALKCQECNGHGTTIEGFTCDYCEGTGELDI